jgi:hypothetical protein
MFSVDGVTDFIQITGGAGDFATVGLIPGHDPMSFSIGFAEADEARIPAME